MSGRRENNDEGEPHRDLLNYLYLKKKKELNIEIDRLD